MMSNNSMQLTALRAAADAERSAHEGTPDRQLAWHERSG